jgi:hypothetical protein
MNDLKTIARLARRSLIVLAAALALTLALYGGSRFFRDGMRTELAQLQQLDTASHAGLTGKQLDLASLQQKINRFAVLRQQGLVGVAAREGWAEQLVASHLQAGLPGHLVYTLHAPKPLALQNGPAARESGTVTSTGPVFHDLDFELNNVHEDELLVLLRDYQAQVKGRFRIQACTLSNPTEVGLAARCTLRFFTIPDAKAIPGK